MEDVFVSIYFHCLYLHFYAVLGNYRIYLALPCAFAAPIMGNAACAKAITSDTIVIPGRTPHPLCETVSYRKFRGDVQSI